MRPIKTLIAGWLIAAAVSFILSERYAAQAAPRKEVQQPIENLVVQPKADTIKFVAVAKRDKSGKLQEIVLYPDLIRGFSVTLKSGGVELFQLKDGKIYAVPHKGKK